MTTVEMTTADTQRAVPGAAVPVREARRENARAFAGGARAMAPFLVGVVPFGVVIGATVAESGISETAGWATSWSIYAGSAQLAVIELVDSGAAPVVAVAAALAVNSRLVLYSGAMAGHWRDKPLGWRALAAYLLVDPSFAVGSDGYANKARSPSPHVYYFGAAITLWVAWQAAIVFGIMAGGSVPEGLELEFAVPLYLVANVLKTAKTRSARVAAVVAAVSALVATALPFRLGIITAIVAGMGAGLAGDRWMPEPGLAGIDDEEAS